eukprot:10003546-Alexandrium_andersonii.AAC.1
MAVKHEPKVEPVVPPPPARVVLRECGVCQRAHLPVGEAERCHQCGKLCGHGCLQECQRTPR